jgi:hypothetical protein
MSDRLLRHMLYLLEKYNGFGYRLKGSRTPYLWSHSSLHERGRYVAERVFYQNAVWKQCGAAMLLRSLFNYFSLARYFCRTAGFAFSGGAPINGFSWMAGADFACAGADCGGASIS